MYAISKSIWIIFTVMMPPWEITQKTYFWVFGLNYCIVYRNDFFGWIYERSRELSIFIVWLISFQEFHFKIGLFRKMPIAFHEIPFWSNDFSCDTCFPYRFKWNTKLSSAEKCQCNKCLQNWRYKLMVISRRIEYIELKRIFVFPFTCLLLNHVEF